MGKSYMEDTLKSSRGRGWEGYISVYTTELQYTTMLLPIFTVNSGFSKSMFSIEYKHDSTRNTLIEFAILEQYLPTWSQEGKPFWIR
jgi:hypothetical protein